MNIHRKNSKSSKKRRAILSLLRDKPLGKELRSQIRKELYISGDKGETHAIFIEFANKGMTNESPIPNDKAGKDPIEVTISEKGLGYLQALEDYGIGL